MRQFALITAALVAAPALGQIDVYVGSRIGTPIDCAEFCCLNTSDPLQNYQEAGLTIDVNDIHFSFSPCGFDSQMYYPNGGVSERINITRIDTNDFGRLEMRVSHGFAGCNIFVWVTPLLNGASLGDYRLDVTGGTNIGIEGQFDEVLIGSYADAATRDAFVETNLNAIALDDVCYEDAAAFTLTTAGTCPGTVRFDAQGATPNGNVAFVYGFGTGPTTIPNSFPCAGTVLNVGNPNLGNQVISADGNGRAILSTFVPAAACNINVQALDLTTCQVSNVVQP